MYSEKCLILIIVQIIADFLEIIHIALISLVTRYLSIARTPGIAIIAMCISIDSR